MDDDWRRDGNSPVECGTLYLITQSDAPEWRHEMAGYSRIYCVGRPGGFEGADGITAVIFQIWTGDADRRWLESKYFDDTIVPLGEISVVIPEVADHPDNLIDACLSFFPAHFADCPSMEGVAADAAGMERLDFHLRQKEIPSGWAQLREEARKPFEDLFILKGELEPIWKESE